MTTPAKILFLDIETAPSLGWVWEKWQTNVIDFQKNWHILSYAYKWAHEKKIVARALPDTLEYNVDRENDAGLLKELRNLLDEADIIVAHNGDSFDLVKINTRMLKHGLSPPKPYKTVDTLKIARKVFAFESNKLDDLCHYLNVGRKLPHTGFNLWKGCMDGDLRAWATMKKYNGHDVYLLERIYRLFLAWAPNHPQVNKGRGPDTNCPKCSSPNVQRRGYAYTLLRQKQRYQCLTCGSWYEGSARKVTSIEDFPDTKCASFAKYTGQRAPRCKVNGKPCGACLRKYAERIQQ